MSLRATSAKHGGDYSPLKLDGSSLTLEALARVARDPRVRVVCREKAMTRVRRCHKEIQRIIARYKKAYQKEKNGADLPNVYGVTTGFGEFKTKSVHPDELCKLQANVLRSHATGVGDTTDPDDFHNYFPAEVVRAALVLRLNTFLKGHSGVQPELVLFIRDMINTGVVPLVPTRGSVGSSGDLCPLAHLFVVMLEEDSAGRCYFVNDAEDVMRSQGELFSSRQLHERMRKRFKRMPPTDHGHDLRRWTIPKPGYKEGLALTNGAAFSAATLALAVADAQGIANVTDIAAAMTLEAICGRTRALDEKIHRARGMRGQADSAANMLQLLAGSQLVDRSDEVQDAYSVRCAPQVHGASRDAVAYARMVAEAEINAATDNPLFFPGESAPCDVVRAAKSAHGKNVVDGLAYSAGNFHGQPVGIAADFLAIALAEFADISERRTQMLLDQHHNRGLPASLTSKPGVHSGLMIAQYCAAGLVSENKVLAHPASVDSIPTSANTEDHVAMASIAARKLRTVLANTQSALAIELMVAAQALDWRIRMHTSPKKRGPIPPDQPAATWKQVADDFTPRALKTARTSFKSALSPGGHAALEAIRRVVDPLCADRVLAEDIRRLRKLIEDGSLVRDVESSVGALRQVPRLISE